MKMGNEQKQMKNYIGIVRDHSGSMGRLVNKAKDDYNLQLAVIQDSAKKHSIDTIGSVIKCGVNIPTNPRNYRGYTVGNEREVVNSNIAVIQPLEDYEATGQATPLFDAVGELIDIHKSVPDSDQIGVSHLIMVITDGQENHSSKWTAAKLREAITSLQNTDRWTFVFRVPQGYKQKLVKLLGVWEDNVIEWSTTNEGLARSTTETQAALSTYYAERATGKTSTRGFFKPDVQHASLKLGHLTKMTGHYSDLVHKEESIRDFCIRSFGEFQIGKAYYQLTKTETVQPNKDMLLLDTKTYVVYGGSQLRRFLGIADGYDKVTKPDPSQYKLFIQSTSTNRKLVPGTEVLYAKYS